MCYRCNSLVVGVWKNIKTLQYSDEERRFMYQNGRSKSHQLLPDQRFQIVISPRAPVDIPEPICALSDGILFRLHC